MLPSALALLLTVGCSDRPTQPLSIDGVYAAVRANGSTLPVDILFYSSGERIRLLHGSLALRTPDTLLLVLQTQYVDANGTGTNSVSDTTTAKYRRSGTVLELSPLDSGLLEFGNPATIGADGSISLTALRQLPPSHGYGTYDVRLIFRR